MWVIVVRRAGSTACGDHNVSLTEASDAESTLLTTMHLVISSLGRPSYFKLGSTYHKHI